MTSVQDWEQRGLVAGGEVWVRCPKGMVQTVTWCMDDWCPALLRHRTCSSHGWDPFCHCANQCLLSSQPSVFGAGVPGGAAGALLSLTLCLLCLTLPPRL